MNKRIIYCFFLLSLFYSSKALSAWQTATGPFYYACNNEPTQSHNDSCAGWASGNPWYWAPAGDGLCPGTLICTYWDGVGDACQNGYYWSQSAQQCVNGVHTCPNGQKVYTTQPYETACLDSQNGDPSHCPFPETQIYDLVTESCVNVSSSSASSVSSFSSSNSSGNASSNSSGNSSGNASSNSSNNASSNPSSSPSSSGDNSEIENELNQANESLDEANQSLNQIKDKLDQIDESINKDSLMPTHTQSGYQSFSDVNNEFYSRISSSPIMQAVDSVRNIIVIPDSSCPVYGFTLDYLNIGYVSTEIHCTIWDIISPFLSAVCIVCYILSGVYIVLSA